MIPLSDFPACPRCGNDMVFSFSETRSIESMFPTKAVCHTCKIAGVGSTDEEAWRMVIHFEPKESSA